MPDYRGCTVSLFQGVGSTVYMQGDGATPLIMVCKKGVLKIVSLLLQHGANIDAQCKVYTEWNMYSYTYRRGHLHYIPCTSTMQNGITAVSEACQMGHLEVVKVLCSHGASLDVTSQVRKLLDKQRAPQSLMYLRIERLYSTNVCLYNKQCGCGAVYTWKETIITEYPGSGELLCSYLYPEHVS